MNKYSTLLLKLVLPVLLAGMVVTGAVIKQAPDRPLAFVQKFKPSVGLEKSGKFENITERGKPLFNGDTLRTDENGFALVQFMDKSMAKVKPESRLIVEGEIEGKQNTSTRIGLEAGEIFLNVTQQSTDNFEVATNTTVASVKGTDFGASSDNYFWVQEGVVEIVVNESGAAETLTAGIYGQVQADGSIDTGDLTDEVMEATNEDYALMDAKLEPQIYELRFIDSNGEEQVIRLRVFENENE
jgi:hypothetical protein